jgi:hypothetical protein
MNQEYGTHMNQEPLLDFLQNVITNGFSLVHFGIVKMKKDFQRNEERKSRQRWRRRELDY